MGLNNGQAIDFFDTDLRPMQYWAMMAEKKIDNWAAGIAEGVSTGFKTFDEYFRLIDGELITIAARPSMGKTILGMQLAEAVARNLQSEDENGCVAVFSAEMSGWALVHRMAGAMAGVNIHKLRMGGGTDEEAQKMRNALQLLRTLSIWIDDGSAPTTDRMLERLARLNENVPVRMMVFDYLELGGDRAQSEDLRIGQIADALKAIAKTLAIPVVALSQLNRSVENRANKMPTMADLRYSGKIEQVSDTVLLIMRPEYYLERGMDVSDIPTEDREGVAYINIAKNRQGPPALVKTAFVKGRMKFADLKAAR